MRHRSRRSFLQAASASAAALTLLKSLSAWAADSKPQQPVKIWSTFRDRRYQAADPLMWKPVVNVAADAIVIEEIAERSKRQS